MLQASCTLHSVQSGKRSTVPLLGQLAGPGLPLPLAGLSLSMAHPQQEHTEQQFCRASTFLSEKPNEHRVCRQEGRQLLFVLLGCHWVLLGGALGCPPALVVTESTEIKLFFKKPIHLCLGPESGTFCLQVTAEVRAEG